MLLAIDVGNTRTKVYNRTRGGELFFETASIIDKEHARKVIEPGLQKDMTMIGASVVPSVRRFIDEASEELLGKKPVWIDASMQLGVPIAYKSPETLGADRLANVIGALDIAKPPLIVVDLGTATKFEAIDHEGKYLGGSIMPSAKMGLKSLRSGTAQLPEVDAKKPDVWIGTDTSSAILTGAVWGHEYAVRGMIAHYYGYLASGTYELVESGFANVEEWAEQLDKRGGYREVTAIVTGGYEKLIHSFKDRQLKGLHVRREPNLCAIGLEIAAKRLGLSG